MYEFTRNLQCITPCVSRRLPSQILINLYNYGAIPWEPKEEIPKSILLGIIDITILRNQGDRIFFRAIFMKTTYEILMVHIITGKIGSIIVFVIPDIIIYALLVFSRRDKSDIGRQRKMLRQLLLNE